MKPAPPPRSHSLENFDASSSSSEEEKKCNNPPVCSPYASSPVGLGILGGGGGAATATTAVGSRPPTGYVLAGQMNLGAFKIPALNSANLISKYRSYFNAAATKKESLSFIAFFSLGVQTQGSVTVSAQN